MDAEALAKALAWASGDLRDWLPACCWCGSENGVEHKHRNVWGCLDCLCESSMQLVCEYRQERAHREVIGSHAKPTFPLRGELRGA